MRLPAKQLFEAFELTKDSFTIYSKESELKIVTDTIAPLTPQRVEGVIPVRTTAVDQIEGSLKREDQKELLKQENKEENTAVSHDAVVRSISDTVKHSKPNRVSEEAVVEAEGQSVPLSTPRRVEPSVDAQESQRLLIEKPIVSRQVDISSDTLSFPLAMDSVAIDTTYKANVEMPVSYSMEGQKAGVPLPIKLDRSDGIFSLLLVCFLLLAHVYNGGVAFFKENIMLVFSAAKSEKLETQATTKESFYSYFLVFLSVLLISISLYEALDRFMPLPEGEKRPFVTIGLFIMLILVFILVKMMFNKLVGYIFDFDKRISTWNKSYLVLLSILGLLCFFPTLILVYSSLWHSIIIGFVLFLFLIVQIILFARIIVFFIGQKFNFLYLIAYLCTIEILPYIFLGIGLVYLYRIDIFNTIL